MSNVNIFIKENVKSIGDYVYVAPEIPEKKLNNAVSAMKCHKLLDSIIAIQDGTVFGKSDEGFIFTGDRMIHDKHGEFLYSEIESVEYKEDVSVNAKGKESIKKYVDIFKGGELFTFRNMYGVKCDKIASFLNDVISNFEDFKNEKQAVDLAEMSDEFKINYLKLVVNMTFEDDGEIDETELSEILLLSTRLKLGVKARANVRSYIGDINDLIESSDVIISNLRSLSDASQHKSIMISIAKDIINVYYSSKSESECEVPFLIKNKEVMQLGDEDLKFAHAAVDEAFSLLRDDVDDNKIRENASQLASTAAAVGAPIAAVYISGSVVGLSASGITSGLATLGLGMGMTGGLAVLGAVGFLTYTGVRKYSGVNELDRYKVKLAMLNEALKQTHLTIKDTIEDVNNLVSELSSAISNSEENRAHILKLKNMVSVYTKALSKANQKADSFENAANRSKCPQILDYTRLSNLCSDPNKERAFEFVIRHYQKNDSGEYVLKKNMETESLDKVAGIIEKLGYFEVGNALKSKLQDKAKGMFS